MTLAAEKVSVAHLRDYAQVPVQGLCGVQKDTANGEAVQGRHDLLRYLPALANATDDDLPATVDGLRDGVDCAHEAFLGHRVGVQELPHVLHCILGGRDDMEPRPKGGLVACCIEDLVRIGRGHGQRRNRLADMWKTGGEEG